MTVIRFNCIALIAFGLAWPASADTQPADAERVARLIAQLGSSQFAEREEATKSLEGIGAPALDDLRKATQSKDAEVRRRAEALVRQIERRLEADRLLKPMRVRLVYKDTPVADALAELARMTGFTIKLEGDRAGLAERRITLDTGDVTFWEAFDRFCAKAGLVETAAAPAPANPGRAGGSVIVIGGNAPVVPRDVMQPDPSDKPEVLVLKEGKRSDLPTHYAGALRIMAQPPGTPVKGLQKGAGEALLGLEVTAEPTMRWQRPVGLRITRALDEEGRTLAALPVSFAKPASATPKGTVTMIINGVPVNPEGPGQETPTRQVPVRLKLGDRPAKGLKELGGTVAALVQSAPQTLATVNDVLKAADQTVKGAAGSSVKVLEVSRADDGQVRLRFVVEPPPRGIEDNSAMPNNAIIIVNGRVLGQNDEPLSAANFALLDGKGKPFKVIKAVNTGRRSGSAQEFDFIYQPVDGQGEPAQFVYSGRLTTVVDVPFTLKDVPLP